MKSVCNKGTKLNYFMIHVAFYILIQGLHFLENELFLLKYPDSNGLLKYLTNHTFTQKISKNLLFSQAVPLSDICTTVAIMVSAPRNERDTHF